MFTVVLGGLKMVGMVLFIFHCYIFVFKVHQLYLTRCLRTELRLTVGFELFSLLSKKKKLFIVTKGVSVCVCVYLLTGSNGDLWQ